MKGMDFEAAFNSFVNPNLGSCWLRRVLSLMISRSARSGKRSTLSANLSTLKSSLEARPVDAKVKADLRYSLYCDRVGQVDDTPVYILDNLGVGDLVEGPATIIENTQAIIVVPGAKAVLTSKHMYIALSGLGAQAMALHIYITV